MNNRFYLGLLSVAYFYLGLKEPDKILSGGLALLGVISMLGATKKKEVEEK